MGPQSSGPGEVQRVHTIAFDSQGRLFAGDRETIASRYSIRMSKLLDIWHQFGRPTAISITKDDTIYVTDSESGPDTGAHELTGIKKGIRIAAPKPARDRLHRRPWKRRGREHSDARESAWTRKAMSMARWSAAKCWNATSKSSE